jgi:hypothetical protein
MTKWLLGLAAVGLTAVAASAQGTVPGQGGSYPYAPAPTPGNFMPNYYNRQTQPLSPYLNLARGGNPGVNYFYGVRPGTTGAPGGTMPAMPFNYAPARGGFIPAASNPEQADTRIAYIPTAAHPVVFGGGRSPFGGIAAPARSGFAGTQMPATAPRRPTR